MDRMATPIKTEAGNLKGRTVVITGGSSGIGLATAQMIVGRGGRVVLIGRTAEKLEQASERLGAGVSTIALDVTDDVALARAFVDIGPFDHLVTAAAGTLRGAADANGKRPIVDSFVDKIVKVSNSEVVGDTECNSAAGGASTGTEVIKGARDCRPFGHELRQ